MKNRKQRRIAAKQSLSQYDRHHEAGAAPTDADLMDEARRQFQSGNGKRAETLCREILARLPTHVDSLNLIGLIAQSSNRHRLSVQMFNRAVASDPLNAACHYNLASSYQALHQANQAVVHFKKAIALGLSGNNVEDFIMRSQTIAAYLDQLENPRLLRRSPDFLDVVALKTIADDLFLRCALDRHKTSVSLEELFWTDLKEIAHTQHMTISKVIEGITKSAKATCRRQYGCLYSIKSASMGNLGNILAPDTRKSPKTRRARPRIFPPLLPPRLWRDDRFLPALKEISGKGLDRGFYHYDAGGHALVPIAVRTHDLEALLTGAKFAMDAPAAPQVLITIAARFGRISWKYCSLAYALLLKDVGVLTQTLYLIATDLGLGGCAVGTTNIDLFAKMTGIEFHVEGAVGQFALGRDLKIGATEQEHQI